MGQRRCPGGTQHRSRRPSARHVRRADSPDSRRIPSSAGSTEPRSELALTAWTNYQAVIGLYITPHLGSTRLVDLSPMDIKTWHAALLEHGRKNGKPLAARTVQLAHRVLRRALADAVRWNLVAANPASATRVPKVEAREMSVWTAEQAGQFLLRSVADDRLAALWTLALHAGLRRGELRRPQMVGCRSPCGDTHDRAAANDRVLSSRRLRAPRPRVIASSCWHHTPWRRSSGIGSNNGWNASGSDQRGRRAATCSSMSSVRRTIRNAFVCSSSRPPAPSSPLIRLHDLRHTMATLALQAGVHPKVVQEQLGHSRIDVTLDVYSHVPQAVRRESAQKIAARDEGT